MDPFIILIGGEKLTGYTSATLTRSKEQLTGSLTIEVFMSYVPQEPVLINAAPGNDVLVYIGGQLAFKGTIDKRGGKGKKVEGGSSKSVSIGKDSYNVTVTCRGNTKNLVDSSHQHDTTNMISPTNRQVIEKLLEPFNIDLDWQADVSKMDKVRFRDGALVIDEVRRVAAQFGLFIYETRDGSLRVTDKTSEINGEPLILGDNLLTFSAEQSEDKTPSSVTVKGQRSKKEIWGEDAVLTTFRTISDASVASFRPLIIQHFGDATPEVLERRARFEANNRAVKAKNVTVDVFHVQSRDGQPWDVGNLHYIEVPPEGIYDVMECTSVTYNIDASGKLETKLSLSPPPAGAGGSGIDGLASFGDQVGGEWAAYAALQKARAGITYASGLYPSPWASPALSIITDIVTIASTASNLLKIATKTALTYTENE